MDPWIICEATLVQAYRTTAAILYMDSAFTFGFSGDDIESEENGQVEHVQTEALAAIVSAQARQDPIPVEVRCHDLSDLVGQLKLIQMAANVIFWSELPLSKF